MHLFQRQHHLLGGTLFIAGTSIGVGMLALPVVTAAGGFFPALAIYLACWLFMIACARLILEACTWMPKDANLITICRQLLGHKGAAICWILYLFLFYCLMTAHVAAGGDAVFHITLLPKWFSTLIYVAVFAPAIYLGANAAGRVNMALMAGVVLTYLFFVFTSANDIQFSFLGRSDWSKIWPALPVILISFGFQNLIPTLYNYMDGDHRTIRKAIWLGTLIPLALYILWEFIVIGIVPVNALLASLTNGESAIPPLQTALQNGFVAKIAQGFAFFAMTTSFIGISIAFFDFWADGLKWKKKGSQRIGLLSLVFLIPLILVFINPSIFITALQLGGSIGFILLFAVLPILFVWSGRYFHGHSRERQFIRGGRYTLAFMLFFSIAVLLTQLFF